MKRLICGLLLFLVGCAALGGRPGNRKELTDAVGDVLIWGCTQVAGPGIWVYDASLALSDPACVTQRVGGCLGTIEFGLQGVHD